MRRPPFPDFRGPEPTAEELADRKRICDRAELLDHVDSVLRPPAWVYEEMEDAIGHALAGSPGATINSRDGSVYRASDLIERWELEDLFEIYERPPDDPTYPSGHW